MKTTLLTTSLCLIMTAIQAQLYNDAEMTSDGCLISDWQNQWFNSSNGIYTGINNGVFDHNGHSLQTFINNGTFNCFSGHTDRFLGPFGGTGAQEIGGTNRPFFFNLQLNNGITDPIHITNSDGANVRGMATFNNGITTTLRNIHQAGALRFESGASYTGGNTDAQHVNGYVSKSGAEAFIFPVGSGVDLRTLSIAAPAVSNEISVAWVAGDPGSITDPSDAATHNTLAVATPIRSVSTSGFWDYVLVSGNDDGLAITVSIPDLSSFGLVPDLRLVGWNGTQWIDLSGGATATGNTENSTLSGTIPSGTTITAIGIGSISYVLPVLFTFFTATASNCEVNVKWGTAMENNNAHFVVERSLDGVVFYSLAQISGAGNSATPRAYQYKDMNAAPVNNYYRIRQVDRDGRSNTTAIQLVEIQCGKQAAIKVYPTITSSTVTITLTEAFKNAQVSLFDITGRTMQVAIHGNSLRYTLSLSDLPSGQYLLRIMKGGASQTFKLIKP